MSSWIDDRYRSTAGWEHVTRLVDIPGHARLSGTEREEQAAELTQQEFQNAGARNVEIEEFDIQGWEEVSSAVTHPDLGTPQDCIALQRSPGGTVEGELVDLGYGLPEDIAEHDLDGKVAMILSGQPDDHHRTVPRIERYIRIAESGAAGFIVRNHLDGDYVRGGNVRSKNGDPIGPIPAVGVSYETGARLSRRFEGGSIEMEVEVDLYDTTSRNVIGEIGPDTDERIIIGCHIDSTNPSPDGAGDDALGVGVVSEVIRGLAAREDELDTRVQFIGFGSEVMGLLGSAYHAARIDTEEVKVMLQNDGIARGSDPRVHTHGFEKLGDPVTAVANRFQEPVTVKHTSLHGSDNRNFAKYGVPTCYFGSEDRDGNPMFGLDVRNVFSPLDTLDKFDPRDLTRAAIWETELIVELANDAFQIDHISQEEVEAQLESEGKNYADWVFPVV